MLVNLQPWADGRIISYRGIAHTGASFWELFKKYTGRGRGDFCDFCLPKKKMLFIVKYSSQLQYKNIKISDAKSASEEGYFGT